MGLDEALLERPDAPPTLRVYTWSPDTLSLGYFQRLSDVPAAARASRVVRRITGGGAIHHARELTFSLCTRADDPVYRGVVADSYARVHGAVAAALRTLGVEARLRGDHAPLASDVDGTGMCFHASTPLDLVWHGRKGLGSAQRRRGGRVLHHASLKLGATELDTGVAELPGVTPRDLARALLAALEHELGIAAEPAEPTPQELEDALERGARYVDPAWVARRDRA